MRVASEARNRSPFRDAGAESLCRSKSHRFAGEAVGNVPPTSIQNSCLPLLQVLVGEGQNASQSSLVMECLPPG